MAVVSRELAVKELTAFIKEHKKKEFRRGLITSDSIESEYLNTIEAIEDGFLVFEDGKPKYSLQEPIEGVVESVTFRSRIKGADKIVLMNGVDAKRDLGTYILKTISYMTGLSILNVKMLEQDDFDVINEICGVF